MAAAMDGAALLVGSGSISASASANASANVSAAPVTPAEPSSFGVGDTDTGVSHLHMRLSIGGDGGGGGGGGGSEAPAGVEGGDGRPHVKTDDGAGGGGGTGVASGDGSASASAAALSSPATTTGTTTLFPASPSRRQLAVPPGLARIAPGLARQRSRPDALDTVEYNPFYNETRTLGCLQWTKVILLLPLALVRVVVFVLTLLLVTLWLLLLGCCERRPRRGAVAAPAPITSASAADLAAPPPPGAASPAAAAPGSPVARHGGGGGSSGGLPPVTEDDIAHDGEDAIPRCRRVAFFPLQAACRVALWCFGYWWIEERYPAGTPWAYRLGCCGCFGYRYLRRPGVPRVVVANHTSFMDALYLYSRMLPTAVGKAAIINLPLVGAAIAAVHPILVPRTPAEKARLPPVIDQIVLRATSGTPRRQGRVHQPIVIFPEGTTVNQRHVVAFQRGAFVPRVTVQPLAIAYPYCALDVSQPPDLPAATVLGRMLCQVYNRMVVTYLPPEAPTSATEPVDAFADRTRRALAAALHRTPAPFTDHDAIYVSIAKRRRFGDYARRFILPSCGVRDAERVLRVGLQLEALSNIGYRLARVDTRAAGYLPPAALLALLRRYYPRPGVGLGDIGRCMTLRALEAATAAAPPTGAPLATTAAAAKPGAAATATAPCLPAASHPPGAGVVANGANGTPAQLEAGAAAPGLGSGVVVVAGVVPVAPPCTPPASSSVHIPAAYAEYLLRVMDNLSGAPRGVLSYKDLVHALAVAAHGVGVWDAPATGAAADAPPAPFSPARVRLCFALLAVGAPWPGAASPGGDAATTLAPLPDPSVNAAGVVAALTAAGYAQAQLVTQALARLAVALPVEHRGGGSRDAVSWTAAKLEAVAVVVRRCQAPPRSPVASVTRTSPPPASPGAASPPAVPRGSGVAVGIMPPRGAAADLALVLDAAAHLLWDTFGLDITHRHASA